MDFFSMLQICVLTLYVNAEDLEGFYRDEQGEGGKICPQSDIVINELAEDQMMCAAFCNLNNNCLSLFYGVISKACFGCKQDLHFSDETLVVTGFQTRYFVKGWQMALTCADILAERPDMTSGRYFNMFGMEIYCDMETDGGGWTVFQRRFENSTEFYRNWQDYKHGFGTVNGGDFWLGLDKLGRIIRATDKQFHLRVDLADLEGVSAYALYQYFDLGGESENYTLHGGNYSGTAGDSLFDPSGTDLNGQMFSTKDVDNDGNEGRNCAEDWKGGWWFTESYCDAILNGPIGDGFGLYWDGLKFLSMDPLKITSIKIREI